MSIDQKLSTALLATSTAAKGRAALTKDLQREALDASSNVTWALQRYYQQLDELEEKARKQIHRRLSGLVLSTDYPADKGSFTVVTGEGPTLITINVEYSGYQRRWYRLWSKPLEVEIRFDVHYGLKSESFDRRFPALDKRGNASDTVNFIRGTVARIIQISKQLAENDPLYASLHDFESELVLGIAELLADPSIASLYTHLDEIESYKRQFKRELDALRSDAKEKATSVKDNVEALRKKVAEKWTTYESEIAAFAKQKREELEALAAKHEENINQEAERVRRSRLEKVAKDVEREKKVLEKEVAKIEKELDAQRKRKKSIPDVAKELSVFMDKRFPNYDFGRNRKFDEEDVSAQLRSECVSKITAVVVADPDVLVKDATCLLDWFVRNIRRSAGEKFNGHDLREITEEVVWMFSNLTNKDINWVMGRLQNRWDRIKVSDVHQLSLGLTHPPPEE